MHENSGNSVIFYAHYTTDGVSTASLTVTIDIYEVIRDGTATLVVNDGSCTDVGAGIYRYLLASGTVDAAAEYIGVFHTATDTVDAQDIPAMWVIDRAGTEKLDTGVTLADDAITASKFDESTAYPLKSADTGATQVARVGADGDTLETLSDEIAAVKAETAAILVDTGTTLDGNITAILADTNEVQAELADGGRTDLLIDAIKAKTDTITGLTAQQVWEYVTRELTSAGAGGATAQEVWEYATRVLTAGTNIDLSGLAPAGEYDAELTAIQADLDNPAQYKADVSALATTAHVQEVENKIDAIDVTTVASMGKIDALDVKVNAIPTTGSGATAQEIWSYHNRSLIQPGVNLELVPTSETITLYRDSSNTIAFSNLGDLSNRTEVWFTIKDNLNETDTLAILQIKETTGITFINKSDGSNIALEGSLTVTDDGTATITLSPTASQNLPYFQVTPIEWDLKIAFANGNVIPLRTGMVYIKATATRSIE